MTNLRHLALLASFFLVTIRVWAQGTPSAAPPPSSAAAQSEWSYSLVTDGYIAPQGQSYVSPVFTANHNWLHLEARYNYESQRTASLWAGYNFTVGKKVQFAATPMVGGVFGDLNGIAPGLELSLTYKKLSFSSTNEYVFDTDSKAGNFYYSWPEVTYSLLSWLNVGLVAQHTRAYHSAVDTQRGFLVGVTYKQLEFTTYVFNPDLDQPTTVLELGVNF